MDTFIAAILFTLGSYHFISGINELYPTYDDNDERVSTRRKVFLVIKVFVSTVVTVASGTYIGMMLT